MNSFLRTIITMYIFTIGRREWTLRAIAEICQKKYPDFTELAEISSTNADYEKETRELIKGLASAKFGPSNPELVRLDPRIDNLMTVIRDRALEHGRTFGGEDKELATKFVKEIFPRGVADIASKPWAEQVNKVDTVINQMKTTQTEAVSEMKLIRHLGQLETFQAEFKEELKKAPPKTITQNEIRARKKEGQERLLEVVAYIIGKFWSRSDEHVEHRSTLLAPVIKQNEELRAYYKRRRKPRDLNPETGLEIVDETVPEEQPHVPDSE